MTKKLVDKQVRINLYPFKCSPFMVEAFEIAAREQGWSETEIALACNQTKELSLDGKFEVLLRYCMTFGEETILCQEDVSFMLDHLQFASHYLRQKPLAKWDEYDWSNYYSLKRKATNRITRVFAHFGESVKEEDKYTVDSPPQKFYDTLEDALEAVPVGRELEINIYPLWIKE